MFTLIKREIEDHLVYFIGAGIISAILAIISILVVFEDNPAALGIFVFPLIPAAIIVTVGFSGMGVSQMYTDRSRRISAFLSTLPVTRDQILTARIITGILAILTFLMPLTITAAVLRSLFSPPIPMYPGLIFDLFIVIFLMSFACYSLGLLTGWTSNKVIPTLGGLALALVLFTLILVKGFGLHVIAILLLFIIASLACIRHRFMSTPL
jgi:hypothetical protein